MSMLADEADVVDLGLRWAPAFRRWAPPSSPNSSPAPCPIPIGSAAALAVARELGLDPAWLQSAEGLAAFTGNAPIAGTRPLASVYSGHQFGVWAGQLGDGRAILLGETDGGPRSAAQGQPA